jgi:hypothetical protein
MRRSPALASQTEPSTGRVCSAWWWAQCLLVLVLAFDLVSAPFHQHRHDGVAGPLVVTAQHTGHTQPGAGDHHAEGHGPAQASHATAALRIDPSRWSQLPPIDSADAQPALASAAPVFAAFDDRPPAFRPPDRDPADFATHRSLPPAGRAPPFHS